MDTNRLRDRLAVGLLGALAASSGLAEAQGQKNKQKGSRQGVVGSSNQGRPSAEEASRSGGAFQVPGGSAKKSNLSRMLFVWDTSIPGDDAETRALLDFAARSGMSALALESSPVGYDLPGALQRYSEFVKQAHAEGILVMALSGYGWFTVPEYAGVYGQPTSRLEGWDLYANVAAAGIFDAILDDSQPYLTNYVDADGILHNYFWDNLPHSAQEYLDYLRGLRQASGFLPHVQVIPFWYDSDQRLDELYLDGSTEPHSLDWYVAQIADAVTVLSYRDKALGKGGIIDMAQGEVQNGPAFVALETQDLGQSLAHVTFHEEGRKGLDKELRQVEKQLSKSGNLIGAAIHYYKSFAQMK